MPDNPTKARKLNNRVCRGCGKVFKPTTSLQRYGSLACSKLTPTLKLRGRFYGSYRSVAVPGAKVNHD